MIDSGSIHKFIDIKIARRLNLFVEVIDIKVMVVDDNKIENTRSSCKYKISSYNQEGSLNMVLGIE